MELGEVMDVAHVFQAGVFGGYAEDLVVAALFVRHAEHADRAGADQAAGKGRLLYQDERVERVAVLAQRAFDEAVVGRVLRRREQRAVEADPAGLVVDFVLVPMTLGDLHCDVEVHVSTPCCRTSTDPTSVTKLSGQNERGAGGVVRLTSRS